LKADVAEEGIKLTKQELLGQAAVLVSWLNTFDPYTGAERVNPFSTRAVSFMSPKGTKDRYFKKGLSPRFASKT
jgi:hypothetical protein